MNVAVIIPSLNEAGCIGDLVTAVWAQPVQAVIVADNGSTDDTAAVAERAGAQVVREARRGYGHACRAGAVAAGDAEVLAFLDGDYSFLPEELPRLLAPMQAGASDLVLGSRALGRVERGSMPPAQRFGNWLVARLMRSLYDLPLTDLGPYRAVRGDLLRELDMREMTYGWPTEMIVKAARRRARMVEVPASYRSRRAGRSKVSGTVKGTVLAGYAILSTTFRYVAWRDALSRPLRRANRLPSQCRSRRLEGCFD
jgi:glycosyltransferase involved in cell wall biosynthesis